jgi:hypothetical protein
MANLRLKLVACAACLACLAHSPLQAQTKAAPTSIDAELTTLYQRFLDGLVARDTLKYRDLLDSNYTYLGDSGKVLRGRTARFAFDLAESDRYDAFTVQRCEVNGYGDAAVGECWFRQSIPAGPNKGVWNGVSLVTFVRGADRRWRIAASRPSSTGPAH